MDKDTNEGGKVVPIQPRAGVRSASFRAGEYTGDPAAIEEMKLIEARGKERERWRLEVWGPGSDPRERMRRLCRSFPCLLGAPGTAPWTMGQEPEGESNPFLEWMCSGPSHGELLAGRFVLRVWNPSTDWTEQARLSGLEPGSALVRFDVLEAMAVWDLRHQEAFRQWVDLPFWP
jgi:hypothetical protein